VPRETSSRSAAWIRSAVAICVVVAVAAVGATVTLAHQDATPLKVIGNVAAGKALFKPTCGGCHTLTAAKTTGTVGPDLDTVSLSEATIVKAITNGGATVMSPAAVKKYLARMPAYKSSLTKTQIQNIAAFVYTAMSEVKTIKVGINDSRIALSPTSIALGKITFSISNTGKKVHNFSINKKTSPRVLPGKTVIFSVSFTKTGKYAYKSTVLGDRRLKGGSLTITKPKTTTTTTTAATTTTATTTSAATTTTAATTTSANPDGCPPGVTIQTSGQSDHDQDETGQGPSDGDGCI
jgi:mono/diheme cytochrome c family protein